MLALLLAFLVLAAMFFGKPGNPWVHEACLRAGLFLVLGMISVVGGRIIPAFTQNWLRLKRPEIQVAVARLQLAGSRCGADYLGICHRLCVVAARVNDRLAGIDRRVRASRAARPLARLADRPGALVVDSASGYVWIPLSLLLFGLGILGDSPMLDRGLHALAYGAIGTLILGVAARVALGHTGRPLQSFPTLTLAFVVISLGTLCRLLVPAMGVLLWLSVALWVLAYALFLRQYTPILLRPSVNRGWAKP